MNPTAVKLRTRAASALLRFRGVGPLPRPLRPLLARGALQVRGGPAIFMRLDARRFPYDGTQAYGMLLGWHEIAVQEAMRRHLPPGGAFIDVGSNLGIHALLAARLVGPSGRVIAVEARAEGAEDTAANLRVNGFGHAVAVHAAVTAAEGTTEVIVAADPLWTRVASVGGHDMEVRRDTVRAVTIDGLVREHGLARLDAIKVDVEGAELDVIEGARETLERLRPAVICEMHGKNAAYVDLMASLDYAVSPLEGPTPVAEADGNTQSLAVPVIESRLRAA